MVCVRSTLVELILIILGDYRTTAKISIHRTYYNSLIFYACKQLFHNYFSKFILMIKVNFKIHINTNHQNIKPDIKWILYTTATSHSKKNPPKRPKSILLIPGSTDGCESVLMHFNLVRSKMKPAWHCLKNVRSSLHS